MVAARWFWRSATGPARRWLRPGAAQVGLLHKRLLMRLRNRYIQAGK